jgi:hypothetical protein
VAGVVFGDVNYGIGTVVGAVCCKKTTISRSIRLHINANSSKCTHRLSAGSGLTPKCEPNDSHHSLVAEKCGVQVEVQRIVWRSLAQQETSSEAWMSM